MSHFFFLLSSLAIVIPTIINSNAWDQFNPLPDERKLSTMSMEARLRTFSNYDLQNLIFQLYGFVLFVLMTIELYWHYITAEPNLELQSEKQLTGARRILSNVIQMLIFIDVSMVFAYIGLAFVWLILSAVLNPEVYLPYAFAAGTVIAVAASKLASMLGIFVEVVARVRFALARHMGGKLESSLKDLQNSMVDGEDVFNADPVLADVVAIIKSDQKLSNTLDKLGLSVDEVISLVREEEETLTEVAKALGMDYSVLHAVIASASLGAIPVKINSLCEQAGVSIDTDTAEIIYDLSKPNTEEALRYAIKRAVVHFSHRNKDLHVSPHVVESIIAITRGSIDRLLEVLQDSGNKNFEQFKKSGRFYEVI